MSADHPTPRANPWARYAAVCIGLILLSVAVICGRELWLRNSSSIRWESWVDPLLETIGAATFQPWMLPAGVGALLLGGFLVWAGLRPRTRTHRALSAGASVWMRPVDIARMLAGAARTVPGVVTAAGHVAGRTATVSITTAATDTDPSPAVTTALTALLADLGLELNLRVRRRPLEEVTR